MNKFDLHFRSPLLNAAGALGFAPARRGPVDLGQLGAFFTNPISRGPRQPADGRGVLPYPGGFLLHSGLPNPGLRAVLRQHAAHWRGAGLPVVVHLVGDVPEDIHWMVRALEMVENIGGIEIGIPPQASADQAAALLQASQGELPVIACLPLERASELAPHLARAGNAAAYSLAAPRGLLPCDSQPWGGKLASGRLYGPGVFPLALAVVQSLSRQGLPVIGGGGVFSQSDSDAMLQAGALAVQLDTVLWLPEGGLIL